VTFLALRLSGFNEQVMLFFLNFDQSPVMAFFVLYLIR
jgi:hypothetical protein